MAARNVKQLLHRQQDPNNIETIQDYRHTETREKLSNSEELPTYIALVPNVQTLRKNDSDQNSTHNRTIYLIREQAGIRAGKSCTSQLLNLTQHIEDGYQECKITGTAFVDLSAAYDTVNHRLQKNGLPQGSVLSPILFFNIYTNDQPIHDGTRSFIYADDLCVTAQYPTFTEVEDNIEEALSELTQYYSNHSLRVNPDKLEFHLRHREVKRSLKIAWSGVGLENTAYPKYLGVTLDRTLNYKQHTLNMEMKVATRNNLIKKLTNSKWGTNARTI